MAAKVRVGVIGVGVLGRHHARLYKECAGADLVGIYDVNPDQAARVAEELGTRVFETIEALSAETEALSIAVPTHYHFGVAEKLLHEQKHLLIEKPITKTLGEAEALLTLAQQQGRIIQVGHVERFNPVISYLEAKLDQPRFIESHRLAPYPPPRPGLPPRGTEVGVVLDLMIHDIDMVLSLVKSPVTDVDAVGIAVVSPTEDIANARIKFANGCVANLTASRVTPEPMRKIRLFQNQCYISLDYMEKTGEVFFREDQRIRREMVPIEDHNALLKQLEHFVSCIQHFNNTGELPVPKVSGEHGTRALELAVRITEKIQAVDPG